MEALRARVLLNFDFLLTGSWERVGGSGLFDNAEPAPASFKPFVLWGDLWCECPRAAVCSQSPVPEVVWDPI